MLMLAVARIGAIHLVVFAGFGAARSRDRITASGSKAVFTADVTYRKGKDVPLKGIVDEALARAGDAVERVVVLRARRATAPIASRPRDLTWDEFLGRRRGPATAATT